MTTYSAFCFEKIGAEDLTSITKTLPQDLSGDQVLIKVHACGACHSDCFSQTGAMTSANCYPLIPGHEVIGEVVSTGPGAIASSFLKGDMVGVGWHGQNCYSCDACVAGDTICCARLKANLHPTPPHRHDSTTIPVVPSAALCGCALAQLYFQLVSVSAYLHFLSHSPPYPVLANAAVLQVSGLHFDGGYAEYMVGHAGSLARVPAGMSAVEAAPLLCAGVTVYNAIAHNNKHAVPGALVAVMGIGGLGHLGIQYAAKMGYRVAAISRGTAKKALAEQLGAKYFIDSTATNPAEELTKLGGAALILATAFNSEAMTALIDGLGRNGVLVVLGATPEPINVSPFQILGQRKSIRGHPSGNAKDSEHAMQFAHANGVKCQVLEFPLAKAPEAYASMQAGNFRVVINAK
ncbi:unnamed protein product [Chrysoparadoxa australica]